jgi:hypothetical protein
MGELSENSFVRNGSRLVNTKEIDSISEYLDYIQYFEHYWNQAEMWFRGVTNKDFKLVPSIYRKHIWNYNQNLAEDMFHQFIRHAKCLNPKYKDFDKWEWYQVQQHYGLPTRLLDWTEGSLIALYFAVRQIGNNDTPAVWVIDPFSFNRITIKGRFLLYSDKLIQDKRDEIINKYISSDELPVLPVAILPTYFDNRISSQKSTFSIHGSAVDGFDQVFFKDKENYRCVQLLFNPTKASFIKQSLVQAGISEVILFPDLEGLAREIKHSYGMK